MFIDSTLQRKPFSSMYKCSFQPVQRITHIHHIHIRHFLHLHKSCFPIPRINIAINLPWIYFFLHIQPLCDRLFRKDIIPYPVVTAAFITFHRLYPAAILFKSRNPCISGGRSIIIVRLDYAVRCDYRSFKFESVRAELIAIYFPLLIMQYQDSVTLTGKNQFKDSVPFLSRQNCGV